MSRRAVVTGTALAIVLALIATPAQGASGRGAVATSTGASQHAYVSAPFVAGRTNTPLSAMSHHPSGTRLDPGEGLGQGKASGGKHQGVQDPLLQRSEVPAAAPSAGSSKQS